MAMGLVGGIQIGDREAGLDADWTLDGKGATLSGVCVLRLVNSSCWTFL